MDDVYKTFERMSQIVKYKYDSFLEEYAEMEWIGEYYLDYYLNKLRVDMKTDKKSKEEQFEDEMSQHLY